MADGQDLREAVGAVEDPLLGRRIGGLGMVAIAERRRLGSDRLTISVPVPNYPALDELKARIQSALLAAGSDADVTYDVMDDAARESMMTELRTNAPPAVGQTGSRTRVVAVSSGKGGVGKSSVTTNLAVALVGKGHSVGVIDGDIWGFSIPRMLGVSHPPVVIHESIIPPVAHGVKAMSMDYFVPDDKAVIWRGPMLHKAIEQFLQDVWWDDPDFLIVDMPPGTGDIAISMAQFLPRAQVLLVTTPQPTAQRVAKRAALMAAQVNQEVMGVVENMSWFTGDDGRRYEIFGAGGGQDLADDLGVPLMAAIPLLPAMRQGADDGIPVVLVAPDSESAAAFDRLAEEVLAKKPRVRTHPELVIR
ncbi:MAG TPA: Mrp/NBP35 family ATP-binding protein [Acidimicrobiia bacterium]|nr:Mrp/NBP35 family ATP-binding protein [Acidimicrobiia bacterium]